jgi:hypothetical protein
VRYNSPPSDFNGCPNYYNYCMPNASADRDRTRATRVSNGGPGGPSPAYHRSDLRPELPTHCAQSRRFGCNGETLVSQTHNGAGDSGWPVSMVRTRAVHFASRTERCDAVGEQHEQQKNKPVTVHWTSTAGSVLWRASAPW